MANNAQSFPANIMEIANIAKQGCSPSDSLVGGDVDEAISKTPPALRINPAAASDDSTQSHKRARRESYEHSEPFTHSSRSTFTICELEEPSPPQKLTGKSTPVLPGPLATDSLTPTSCRTLDEQPFGVDINGNDSMDQKSEIKDQSKAFYITLQVVVEIEPEPRTERIPDTPRLTVNGELKPEVQPTVSGSDKSPSESQQNGFLGAASFS
ncbi:hypothetical protein Ptr902_10012 [Pyrenophora tritici-repentis]|uniref:Uncharacterized protein n=1 Tax=Pyrenophora tritici-repentis TaxID=45151 RepID=A0A5M9KUJ4_9PLEO|nr:hypothetical protein PtrV1_12559 [Pyrenophora tritici-repentis]KAF7445370.1 hypothetical protein A1F99_103560 [Pyrenophora tritici-repentis]KAF7565634.1 hypothetical protein PtrM4_050680 [Pyrenophora tritici-repentis]KAI0570925.1 hypothetical protein Alg215_10747 [Pyrenophora tritici-repentis]KAI0572469.1 hypothetical protein Alg130_10486 [Pyrenophora tritici-repentis]